MIEKARNIEEVGRPPLSLRRLKPKQSPGAARREVGAA
jgi:hypothetical protein